MAAWLEMDSYVLKRYRVRRSALGGDRDRHTRWPARELGYGHKARGLSRTAGQGRLATHTREDQPVRAEEVPAADNDDETGCALRRGDRHEPRRARGAGRSCR